MSATLIPEIRDNTDEKAHQWRICPIGKHFVREHIVHHKEIT